MTTVRASPDASWFTGKHTGGLFRGTSRRSSAPAWVQRSASGAVPYLDIDFLNNRAWQNGVETTIAAVLTPSTGVMATYLDAGGLITGGADFRVTTPGFLNTTGFTVFCSITGGNAAASPAAFGGANLGGVGNYFFISAAATPGWVALAANPSFGNEYLGFPGGGGGGLLIADDKVHHVAMRFAPSNYGSCIETGEISTSATGTLPVYDTIWVGGQTAGTRWTTGGRVRRFTAYASALTNNDLQVLTASQADFWWLVDGDSIPVHPNFADCWPTYLRKTIPAPLGWNHQNLAVSASSLGGSTSAVDLSGATRVATRDAQIARYKAANPGKPYCIVVLVGHNDYALDSDSTATFLTQYAAYCDTLRAAGHPVAIWVVPPSTTAGLNAWRATVNGEIATWVGVHADYVIGYETTIAGFLDSDATDTAKWSDGVHPATAEIAIMAAAAKAQALDLAAA